MLLMIIQSALLRELDYFVVFQEKEPKVHLAMYSFTFIISIFEDIMMKLILSHKQ